MNTYKSGEKVYISVETLEKYHVDINLYPGFIKEGFCMGKILGLHSGRTWSVEMEFGEVIKVASRNFYREPTGAK